jgi:hypothetical protein
MPPRDTIPIRIRTETRDDLAFLRRELSVKYGRDFTTSDVIDYLMFGYSGNPKLAENLREIIARKPSRSPEGFAP